MMRNKSQILLRTAVIGLLLSAICSLSGCDSKADEYLWEEWRENGSQIENAGSNISDWEDGSNQEISGRW